MLSNQAKKEEVSDRRLQVTMSRDRLILLWTAVFVAIVGPIIASAGLNPPQLIAKLGSKRSLELKQIKEILQAIREHGNALEIAGATVERIFERAESSGESRREDCLFGEFARDNLRTTDEDERLLLNLNRFVNQNYPGFVSICATKIQTVFKDNRQLAKLGKKVLLFQKVGDIFSPIIDKDFTKLGKLSVNQILFEASKDQPVPDCSYSTISRRLKEMWVSDLNTMSNVYNFAYVRSKQFLSLCGEIFLKAFEDNQQLEKLNDNELTTEQVGQIFSSIHVKEHAKVCDISVQAVVDQAGLNGFSAQDCQLQSLLRRREFASSSDSSLRSVPNVHKFINERYRKLLSFCEQKFNQATKDLRLLERILEAGEDLSIEEVGEIASSIVDKENAIVGGTSLQAIWDQANRSGSSMEDCQYDVVSRHRKKVMDSRLSSVPSLYKFANARYEQLLLACAEHFRQVLESSQQLDKLGDKRLTSAEIGQILHPIEDKENAKIGELSMQTVADEANRNEFSPENCLNPEILIVYRPTKGMANRYTIENIYRFRHQQLMSFCARHIEQVFAMSVAHLENDRYSLDKKCRELNKSKQVVRDISFWSETELSKSLDEMVEVKCKKLESDCNARDGFRLDPALKSDKIHEFDYTYWGPVRRLKK